MSGSGGGKAKKKGKRKKKKRLEQQVAKTSTPVAKALDMSLEEYGSL